MSEASSEAQQLIDKIMSEEIQKDILMNNAEDFTGKGEQNVHERYTAYLRSFAYEIARSIKGASTEL